MEKNGDSINLEEITLLCEILAAGFQCYPEKSEGFLFTSWPSGKIDLHETFEYLHETGQCTKQLLHTCKK